MAKFPNFGNVCDFFLRCICGRIQTEIIFRLDRAWRGASPPPLGQGWRVGLCGPQEGGFPFFSFGVNVKNFDPRVNLRAPPPQKGWVAEWLSTP